MELEKPNTPWTIEDGETISDVSHHSDDEDGEWFPTTTSSHNFSNSARQTKFEFDNVVGTTCCIVTNEGALWYKIDWKEKIFRVVCDCPDCLLLPVNERFTRPTYYLCNSDGHTYLCVNRFELYNHYE